MPRLRPLLLLALLLTLLAACTPRIVNEDGRADLRDFGFEPLPLEERYIVAVPDFAVRAGSVRVGRVDISQEGEEFYRELGSGVADIFLTEAFRSGRFRITERSELDKILREQNLALSGRIDPATAADVGRITGAELIVLGSLTEFGVTTTGGGGRVLGIFGGSTETVTARVTVDIRMVDAVTAEVLAIGVATSDVSQSNVQVDIGSVLRALRAGRSGTTIVDIAVRNAIRGAISEAATTLPEKSGD
jgi:curli biogenesis system outer membrane secretion channel CsgG